jgi:MFS family permease
VFGLMPAFAEEVLRTNAVGLGYLMAAGALGSILGTVVVARYGNQERGRTLLITGALLPLLVALFAMTRSLWMACVVLVFVGILLLIVQSLAITLVQVHIPDRVRGRVMSIYSQAHAGSDTLGNVFAGSLAVYTGLPLALTLGAGVALVWVLIVYGVTPLVRRLN